MFCCQGALPIPVWVRCSLNRNDSPFILVVPTADLGFWEQPVSVAGWSQSCWKLRSILLVFIKHLSPSGQLLTNFRHLSWLKVLLQMRAGSGVGTGCPSRAALVSVKPHPLLCQEMDTWANKGAFGSSALVFLGISQLQLSYVWGKHGALCCFLRWLGFSQWLVTEAMPT